MGVDEGRQGGGRPLGRGDSPTPKGDGGGRWKGVGNERLAYGKPT